MLFADVVGSTALGERVDPETLRWAMQRWFVRMRAVVEQHGGMVEHYIGDAVMAIFGVPMAHEDDALRAVRAAVAMRQAIATLGPELQRARGVELAVRMGVNTGEAVTGAAAGGGSFTAGDAVNVAARLEQSAPPGEILLGRDTFRMVGHAVDAEPVGPLMVKGKSAAIEAYRLVDVAPDAPPRPPRQRAPMVGREHERSRLVEAFDRVVASRSCELLTVVGGPGVGKSRLVDEVIGGLVGSATVTSGRCLPYGDGLTWWPLVEALGSSGLFERVSAAGAHPAITRSAELFKPEGEPVKPDEAFWAVRMVVETLARRQPLVLFVEDLQWAEPTFLDLLEHVAFNVRDAPILLLATARPELLELRPGWAYVRLEPLADAEAGALLRHLVGTARIDPRAAERVLDVAEGNPLFVVEFVSMLIDDGLLAAGPEIAVPPTIQALLAARLDRLNPSERAVIEAASVAGKEFARDILPALVPETVGEAELGALVRKDLIRPLGPGGQRFRFRHQMIRDVAYEGISKELRADLHERLAGSLAADPPALVVADELLGYHLERAVLLRRELGEAEAATAELAARASTSLSAAGQRAAQRDEAAAAAGFLERAIALVEADEAARSALQPALGASLYEAGRLLEAIMVLDKAIAGATDPHTEARARVERELVRLEAEPGETIGPALEVAGGVLSVLDHDDYGQCRAWSLSAQAHWLAGSVERADEAWSQAAACARRSGDERELFGILGWRSTAAVLGPTPVDVAVQRCETFLECVRSSPVAEALVMNPLASLQAMRGDFALAERCVDAANETIHQLGSLGWVSHHEALVRLLAGQPELAEVPLRAGLERLASMRDRSMLATTAAMLAQALYAQDRLDEAAAQCDAAEDAAAPDDIVTQVIWRGVKAKILADGGRREAAETLARSAVVLVEPTDLLSHRGDALLDLAAVLRTGEAYQRTVTSALSLYESKGNAVGAARSRALLGHR